MPTYGSPTAPSNITQYFDALFTQSLAKYEKKLIDNIGAENAIFHMMLKRDFYQGEDGGTRVELPLMYQLAAMDSYDGYDELADTPTDGITNSIWDWRQNAVPIVYNMKEVIQNKEKIIDLVESKMMQAEMGFTEGFSTVMLQGSGAGALTTPKVSAVNGSQNVEPLPKLIHKDPTSTLTVGNIAQQTYSWWRNKTKQSAATTMTGLLQEFDDMYNQCSIGTGGPPDIILCDRVTYQLLVFAIYKQYRQTSSDNTFPFENTKFKKALITWDEKVPDVENDTLDATGGKGTAYFINSKFFRIKYIKGRNFEMLKDENGKTFVKPPRGDSRIGHMAWMGQLCVNNRRKHGVMYNIARTLTNS